MALSKRIFLLCSLIGLGCSAQLVPSEVSLRIERQLRASYNIPETVKVIISPPQASDFPSYDALTITFDGEGRRQTYNFLLSKDRKTLIRITRMDLTHDPYADTMQKIDLKGRPVRGTPGAKVVLVNYDDLQCPFCARMHQLLFPQLLKEYGDRVAFIYKDFPLAEIHPWAIHAAIDANCLAAMSPDAYWDFADYVHANQQVVSSEKSHDAQYAALDRITATEASKFGLDPAKLQPCIKAQKDDLVKASLKEGESLGVSGTPTMFINGQMMDGVRSVAELRTTLDGALRQAGLEPPAHPAVSAGQPAPAGDQSARQH